MELEKGKIRKLKLPILKQLQNHHMPTKNSFSFCKNISQAFTYCLTTEHKATNVLKFEISFPLIDLLL